jgi:hypothetical protein
MKMDDTHFRQVCIAMRSMMTVTVLFGKPPTRGFVSWFSAAFSFPTSGIMQTLFQSNWCAGGRLAVSIHRARVANE